MSFLSILIIGATGYVGGTLLAPFKHALPHYKIVSKIRSEKQTDAVRVAGVDEVIASFEEYNKFRDATSKADIVINVANSDDLALAKVPIEGLKIKAKTSKVKPVLTHTSGTGVIFERPDRTFFESKEYNDNSEADIRGIDPNAMHHNVDLEVFKVDSQGIISACIICPPAIYGVGKGPGHKTSVQIPIIVRDALKRKRAAHVGAGENLWDNRALSEDASKDSTPYSKFYFSNAAKHSWEEVARQVGDILFAKEKIDAPGAISVTLEDGGTLFYIAPTGRTVSERAYGLGWKPTKPSLKDSLEADVDATLTEMGQS